MHVNDKLGEGSFKIAKLAKSVFTEDFIVITHLKPSAETKKGIENFRNEYLLHKRFQGVGFMQVFDLIVYKDKKSGQHAILAGYYPTNVNKVISGNDVMPQKTQAKAMLQASLAVAKMHKENFAHLDIKPDNIYLKWDPANPENVIVGLGDFGEARELTKKNFAGMDGWGGTMEYHSPERYAKTFRVFAENPSACQATFQMSLESLTKASDIYALGKVFAELTLNRVMSYEEGVEFAKEKCPKIHCRRWLGE